MHCIPTGYLEHIRMYCIAELYVESGNIMRNKKKFAYNNEDIVFEYFKLVKNKDIESLMELFVPDAIVYEPFSKITGGLKGKRAIESFLRVAVMANDTLQHQIVLEKEANLDEPKSDYRSSSNNRSDNNNNNINLITALVKFEKGDSVKARFTFELASDNSGNDNGATVGQKYNRIKTLHIQFLK
jgi:hypothetical protein